MDLNGQLVVHLKDVIDVKDVIGDYNINSKLWKEDLFCLKITLLKT